MENSNWIAQADSLQYSTGAFINGELTEAKSGATFPCVNPANGKLLGNVARCDQADVDLAVRVARRVFDSGVWSALAPTQRKAALQKYAALIEKNTEKLAMLETIDAGKPIADTLGYDAPATARCIAWNAEAIDKLYDEVAPVSQDSLALVTREPLGVVAAIVPWNFPAVMMSWKLGPALAAGNSVIVKPSEKSPLSAIFLAELAHESGIPAGVFQVLPGFGHEAGQALALHQDVDCITFTGSTAVGKKLLTFAGESNMKRAFMECGGKSPHIIFSDVKDIDKAVNTAAAAICYNQGEVCTAGSRLLVQRDIYEQVIEKLLVAIKTWQPGNPLEPSTNVGAIIDQQQLDRILDYINIGQAEGATLLCGGQQVLTETGGLYVEPCVFTDVTPGMRIFKEEIFGSVLAVTVFDTLEEAITLANDSEYGLAAGVWTRDISTAVRCSRALRAGTVFVNNWDGGDMTMPFGGYKQSGNGRDKSLHAIEKYTEMKSTWIELD
ncbi:aldehyde dehydrogenase [Reinekea marinisedimentorum]|uniref:4-guanidinobutyraldehyde dehydrogenase/NAD-dependent aldehyde dehydrogenase n=1 Tax=Reinekea marinisedimentorum TaxID=230495 RepID=A0A4R3I465_9GAMM|nr:aldehyde dehydrogenase [Reinekea marinisedimentorum]TCS40666.1 4-guanidinobutyraldehyde dehydrogenase/NAD-dependent aldehyde dehydrogenase [Reinekea marinisedimentorum]